MADPSFLFLIAGLSVSLAGFSGLVVAFRRGGPLTPTDAYRLRQIPEIGLTTALMAVGSVPVADTVGVGSPAVRIMSGFALVFTTAHIATLWARRRKMQLRQDMSATLRDGLVFLAIIAGAGFSIAIGSAVAYEWLLALMLARPMVAFVMVLADVASG